MPIIYKTTNLLNDKIYIGANLGKDQYFISPFHTTMQTGG
jgi:hypothetical protein